MNNQQISKMKKGTNEKKAPVIKINTKWYRDIVKERKQWIKHSEGSIAYYEKMLEDEKAHLEKLKLWLSEAEKNLAEFKSNKQIGV